MQSTSIPPWHTCYYPIPKHFYTHHLQFPRKQSTQLNPSFALSSSHSTTRDAPFVKLIASSSCSKEQERRPENISHPHQRTQRLLRETQVSVKPESKQSREDQRGTESECTSCSGIPRNMWWADLKAALGQRINIEGLTCSVGILARDRQLVIPHVSVPDIRYIDWAELKRRGFKGVVFDKDNTITAPYSLSLWSPLGSSVEQCKSLFGNNIAVFSNSAGLCEYDPDGRKAKALESAIGIKVIRHRTKKPAGNAEEIERHFGCESSRLIMVGDRPFTDIVYGNRNGFLTILTEPLSLAEEPFIVKQVRKLEVALVNRWTRNKLKSITHELLPVPEQCIKDKPQ